MTKNITPPQPGRFLYESLFVRREQTTILELLSKGLCAFAQNANWLLEDAKLLADAERYARAGFLVATADEEIAKSYIILDACRLDFALHEGPLRRLCHAFYDHIEKHAYNKVVRFNHFHDMHHVREFFYIELRRWWPSGDIESGEPDMPHETYFARQANLYVDFSDYDQAWLVPRPDTRGYAFERILGPDALSASQQALNRLLSTRDEGLYKPEVLSILNEIFKKHYVTERTPNDQLFRLYEMVAEKTENVFGIPRNKFKDLALMQWPLYHFLQTEP